MNREEIPSINIKLEERVVESKIIHIPYILITPPYMIIADKNGIRRVWTKDKKKIVLYYLYKITKIKWFIKKYNEQPR